MTGTILVAGATGNTGRALVRRLAQAGMAVRAAALGRDRLLALGVPDVVEIDYASPITLHRAMGGIDSVYMAAPLGPELVAMTERMVAAAVKAGVRRFVKLSGPAAAEPLEIMRWHRDAERVIEDSGLIWTHLRPNLFMQNFISEHLGSMRERGHFYDPVGSARVSYIDVEDVAAVAAAVLTGGGHANQTYSLTGPAAVSSHEAAELLSRAAGRTIRCIEVSVDAARDALFGFGVAVPVVDALTELYQCIRTGRLAGVTSSVRQVTGALPRSFSQFADGHGRDISPAPRAGARCGP